LHQGKPGLSLTRSIASWTAFQAALLVTVGKHYRRTLLRHDDAQIKAALIEPPRIAPQAGNAVRQRFLFRLPDGNPRMHFCESVFLGIMFAGQLSQSG
jgi:hypothetical protein